MTEERKEYILTVAKYAILTGYSTRKLASIFGVSNFTIHSILTNQLERLCEETRKKEYFDIQKEALEVLKANKPATVDDINVQIRVLEAAKLLLNGKKIKEIAQILGSTFYTIYRDLTVRLPKMKDVDEDLINKVKQIMNENKELNLELGRLMTISENKRDEKGKFI